MPNEVIIRVLGTIGAFAACLRLGRIAFAAWRRFNDGLDQPNE